MARPATGTLSGGDVLAFTSYAVNDGVVRPYGQVPINDCRVVFHDQRGAAACWVLSFLAWG